MTRWCLFLVFMTGWNVGAMLLGLATGDLVLQAIAAVWMVFFRDAYVSETQ